ncbi:hypothetical protein CGZ93_17905 [Enemella dayhoffiae]|uniref:DUF3168 domain-containing protein n=1 Tax=Enemella dayhoffiae TaxID=2016507 RepID=A0A255GLD1_9ACTN|nr:minor capsid protein [Enemella dayhoffiae]OYO16635.1 hypothetical protein CGZ93_17905 [Enemella dayhoffiae]
MNGLLEGIAQHLAAGSVGLWRANGVYTATETGIVIDAIPQSPDNLITLTAYPVADELEGDALSGVQVITRAAGADPRPSNDLAGRVFAALHGLESVVLNGIPVTLCWRQSSASLGQDGVRRWSRSQNFYIRTELGAA